MTTVRDEARQVFTSVEKCKACGAPTYWSLTGQGKRARFNVSQQGDGTRVLHSTTCVPQKEAARG